MPNLSIVFKIQCFFNVMVFCLVYILFYNNDIENEIYLVSVKLKVIYEKWIDMLNINFSSLDDFPNHKFRTNISLQDNRKVVEMDELDLDMLLVWLTSFTGGLDRD